MKQMNEMKQEVKERRRFLKKSEKRDEKELKILFSLYYL